MSEINDENIKQWSLNLSDQLSAKLKSNISFKDFDTEELIFREFIDQINGPCWTTLCENSGNQQAVIITMNYQCIIATTNIFFSNSANINHEKKESLTFTERFIAGEISNEIIQAFETNDLTIKFTRNEPQFNLIRPFHEDESITIYTFNWLINNDHYGKIKLCHSHVL